MSVKLSARGTLQAQNVGFEGNGVPDAVVALSLKRDVGNLTLSVKTLEASLGKYIYESAVLGVAGPVAPNVFGEVAYEVGTKSLAASLKTKLTDVDKRELELGATWTEKSGDFHLYAESKPHPNHKVFAKYSPARSGVEARYSLAHGAFSLQPAYNFTKDIGQLQATYKQNGQTLTGRVTSGKNVVLVEWQNPQGVRVGASAPFTKGARPSLYISAGLDASIFSGTTPALPADSPIQVKDAPLATAIKQAQGGYPKHSGRHGVKGLPKDNSLLDGEAKAGVGAPKDERNLFQKLFNR